jgi:hypothetical protein
MDPLDERSAVVLLAGLFVLASVAYGIQAGKVIGVTWIQNDKSTEALRLNDLSLFESYCYRRIPGPMKILLFNLSAVLGYSIANIQLNTAKNTMISQGLAYFLLITFWMVAYEMDDPLCGVWNVRSHLPEGWWEKIKINFHISEDEKIITLKEEALFGRMTGPQDEEIANEVKDM